MTTSQSIARTLKNPGFLVVAGILLLSAVSLNAATQFLQLYFQKLPVEMRRPISSIPERIGPWVQLSKDQPLAPDIETMLQTKQYVSRAYVDTRVTGEDIVKAVENKTFEEREHIIEGIRMRQPLAVIRLHTTYYTGMVDTVAHVPDRCYVAGGYESTDNTPHPWQSVSKRIGHSFASPFMTFEDQTGIRDSRKLNVTYLFHANGEYCDNANAVRLVLQSLQNRYAYYAKVELMTVAEDRDASARVMDEFLGHLLPEFENLMPDWKEVTSRPVK
jgi:hypothetical protein